MPTLVAVALLHLQFPFGVAQNHVCDFNSTLSLISPTLDTLWQRNTRLDKDQKYTLQPSLGLDSKHKFVSSLLRAEHWRVSVIAKIQREQIGCGKI